LNLNDFDFLEYDEEKSRLTIDPNKLNETLWDKMITLNVKLENKEGSSAVYTLAIIT